MENIAAVRARAFHSHPNIEEVICHVDVKKIEEFAFQNCPRLRRVIMPGVKVLEQGAFYGCKALTYIECGKLERIGKHAFSYCRSLNNVDLPSIRILERHAFASCKNLINAKFGEELESIGTAVFYNNTSLERINLPLKNRMITADDEIFRWCAKLIRIDLVGGVHETVAALLMEEWKNDMNDEITAINRILPNTPSGNNFNAGGKAHVIRAWIRSVLHKIIEYKAEHRRYLNEAATTLQQALPNDIVLKNVLPFLELPSHTFDGEN